MLLSHPYAGFPVTPPHIILPFSTLLRVLLLGSFRHVCFVSLSLCPGRVATFGVGNFSSIYFRVLSLFFAPAHQRNSLAFVLNNAFIPLLPLHPRAMKNVLPALSHENEADITRHKCDKKKKNVPNIGRWKLSLATKP